MNPSFENASNRNDALYIMSVLSPMARDSLENENYRSTAYSDDVTQEYILEDAFQNLIKDLQNIGLVLNIDYSSYVEEMGVLFSFLRFADILLPNTLYNTLKTDTQVRELVERIVSGDLGDNETYIQIYLSEMGGLDGQTPIYPGLSDFLDQMYPLVSQTENFSDYFKNMIKLLHEERLMIESDHEMHTKYTNKVKYLIGRFSDATNLFSNDPRYPKMCKLQDMCIRDFLSPINFNNYAYLFLETPETLPEDLIDRFYMKQYYYRVSNLWCFDYYHLRNLLPYQDSGTWPTILCFLYAMNETQDDFTKEFNKIKEYYPNKSDEDIVIKLY